MLKSALFGRKKTGRVRPFSEFYDDWFTTLATALLPQLRRVLPSFPVSSALLSVHVDAVHNHLHSYYTALDEAAAADVAQCLYPDWRNSLEIPFLWLGDLHPYLFTNLLRSFLDNQDDEDDAVFDNPSWDVAAAWRNPSKALTTRIDQIECGLRLMVPALAARARHAQAELVKKINVKGGMGEAVAEEMEELVGVVVDANRLRKSVLADVLSVTSVYQAALFLEAVAQFLVGFRDEKLLKEFEKCEKAIN